MASTRVQFENLRGQTLTAYLEQPDVGEPIGSALFAHCLACGEDSTAAVTIAQALAGQGIATLRLDFTGLGQSERTNAGDGSSIHLGDLFAASKWMHAQGQPFTLLVGHSLAGSAALVSTQVIKSIKAVATIGAAAEPLATNLMLSTSAEIEQTGEALVRIGKRDFRVQKELVDDLERARVTQCVRDLEIPLLVLHGPDDLVVGLDEATKIFAAAEHPKSFVSLDEVDHLLSTPGDARFVGDTIGVWARRYLTRN